MIEKRDTRYGYLDAVRGIAASVVVLHHCLLCFPRWSGAVQHGIMPSGLGILIVYPPLNLIWSGQSAVYVFFALSGFVLALMFMQHTAMSYAAFVAKRVCRIYLPYLAIVSLAMILMTVTAPHHLAELSEWYNSSWNRGVNLSLVVDHALMLGQQQYNYVDNPVWSLVHEMRYSLIFPVIMWFVRRKQWAVIVTGSFVISVASMVMLNVKGYSSVVDSCQYLFLFVSGAALAIHRNEVAARIMKAALPMRVCMGVTSLLMLSTRGLAFSQYWTVRRSAQIAPHIGATLLLICIIGSPQTQHFLKQKPLLWLGRVSYSLYLSHVVLLLTLVTLLHRFIPNEVLICVTFVTTFVVSAILYQTLERPAIHLGSVLASRIDINHPAIRPELLTRTDSV